MGSMSDAAPFSRDPGCGCLPLSIQLNTIWTGQGNAVFSWSPTATSLPLQATTTSTWSTWRDTATPTCPASSTCPTSCALAAQMR